MALGEEDDEGTAWTVDPVPQRKYKIAIMCR